jgi:hypothetical protein
MHIVPSYMILRRIPALLQIPLFDGIPTLELADMTMGVAFLDECHLGEFLGAGAAAVFPVGWRV